MNKDELLEEIGKKIPDNSRIVYAEITVLTTDFETLNCTVEYLDSNEMIVTK